MGLWEYTQKRMAEIGVTQRQLTEDFDISPATLQRIRQDRPIKESTKQKLALALKCSVGDIQTAISGYKGRPAVEKMPEGPALDPENEKEPPAKITQRNIKIESIAQHNEDHAAISGPRLGGKIKAADLKPAKQKEAKPKERWPEDPPEEITAQKDGPMYTESEVNEICKKKVNEYIEKLKNICLETHANMPALNLTGETPAGMIGRALMAELTKEDTGAE